MTQVPAAPPEEANLGDLVLRCYKQDDAPALSEAVAESLEHLRPWMPWVALEPLSPGERQELFQRWDREWAKGRQYLYGMFLGSRVVGGAGLMRRIAEDGLEIGYWVHPDYVGRGYATRASEVLTTFGLALPGITHIEIHHDKANVRSGRVPFKLGYELVSEAPANVDAPGETGVRWVWRMDRAKWAPDTVTTASAPGGSDAR
jgi:RimJ/RimL family protein N-acetyltransferase